jgi:hypothetical protein
MAACHGRLADKAIGPRPGGCACTGRAGSVVTARGGALANGPVVAGQRQGVAGELMGTTGRALGNESGGGAH